MRMFNCFPFFKHKKNKKSDIPLINIESGTVHRSDNLNSSLLIAKLNVDEACVVFYAWYDDHAGHRALTPTVVMLHWAKSQGIKKLSELVNIAVREEDGIGFLHGIKVYIVSHPRNTIGLENQIRDEIGKVSNDLFLASQVDTFKEDDDDINDRFDIKKIKCEKNFEQFEVNLKSGLPKNLVATPQVAFSKENQSLQKR